MQDSYHAVIFAPAVISTKLQALYISCKYVRAKSDFMSFRTLPTFLFSEWGSSNYYYVRTLHTLYTERLILHGNTVVYIYTVQQMVVALH